MNPVAASSGHHVPTPTSMVACFGWPRQQSANVDPRATLLICVACPEIRRSRRRNLSNGLPRAAIRQWGSTTRRRDRSVSRKFSCAAHGHWARKKDSRWVQGPTSTARRDGHSMEEGRKRSGSPNSARRLEPVRTRCRRQDQAKALLAGPASWSNDGTVVGALIYYELVDGGTDPHLTSRTISVYSAKTFL